MKLGAHHKISYFTTCPDFSSVRKTNPIEANFKIRANIFMKHILKNFPPRIYNSVVSVFNDKRTHSFYYPRALLFLHDILMESQKGALSAEFITVLFQSRFKTIMQKTIGRQNAPAL